MPGDRPPEYRVVPLLGPDGAGKTSLLQAMAGSIQRRYALPTPPLRAVHDALVLDIRTAWGFLQHVDFASAAVEENALGASRFQGALLVVSAIDSIVPETVRSLTHAREVGISRIAIALTKCDVAADPELLDLVEMEARECLNKQGHPGEGDGVPVWRVAAFSEGAEGERWAASVAQLCDAAHAWFG